jgi:hypothetical protein
MKKLLFGLLLLFACQSPTSNKDSGKFSPVGTWILVSRVDKTENDSTLFEPSLGSDPIALLMYDSLGNVSVQIMKRNRQDSSVTKSAVIDQNNSTAMNGYDAYFGKYSIDFAKKQISHHIVATLDAKTLNKTVIRNFDFLNDTLRLSFKTINQNFSVTRTLTWVKAK